MTKLLYSLLGIVIVICALGAGFWLGTQYGQKTVYMMLRVQTKVDIEAAVQNANKPMIEYLKSRYYYFSNRAGVRLQLQEGNYGPIDESVLQGFLPGKGPTTFKEEYEEYLRISKK